MATTKEEEKKSPYNPHLEPDADMLTGFVPFIQVQEKEAWRIYGDSHGREGINFDRFQAKQLTEKEILALRGALLIIAHVGADTSKRLAYFREHHVMTSIGVVQGYEELKHLAVLEMYLELTEKVNKVELGKEIVEATNAQWDITRPDLTVAQNYAQAMAEHHILELFFSGFANSTTEPLLKYILPLLAQDSGRYSRFYLEQGQRWIGQNSNRMSEVIDCLTTYIPGPRSLHNPDDNYQKYGQTMRQVGVLDESAVSVFLAQTTELVGIDNLLELKKNPVFRTRMLNQWGVIDHKFQ